MGTVIYAGSSEMDGQQRKINIGALHTVIIRKILEFNMESATHNRNILLGGFFNGSDEDMETLKNELQKKQEKLHKEEDAFFVAFNSRGRSVLEEEQYEWVRGSKRLMTRLVAKDSNVLQYASKGLKEDKEFMLAAVQQNGWALKYASEELKEDREFILAAVQPHGWALQFASEVLKDDREVVLAAVQQNGDALQYASKGLKGDKEVVLAVTKDSMHL